jgi:hypothetical protein
MGTNGKRLSNKNGIDNPNLFHVGCLTVANINLNGKKIVAPTSPKIASNSRQPKITSRVVTLGATKPNEPNSNIRIVNKPVSELTQIIRTSIKTDSIFKILGEEQLPMLIINLSKLSQITYPNTR